jgi:hypothetical protein
MAFEPTRVVQARQAVQYDGTNSAELNNAVADLNIVSEDASGLTFTSSGQEFKVAPQGYVTWYKGAVDEVFQNEQDYASAFAAVHDTHVHDLILTSGPAKSPEPAV